MPDIVTLNFKSGQTVINTLPEQVPLLFNILRGESGGLGVSSTVVSTQQEYVTEIAKPGAGIVLWPQGERMWINGVEMNVTLADTIPEQPTATAPAQVTELTYAAPQLTWTAPADGGSAITRYEVQIVAAGATWGGTITATSTTTALNVSSQPSGNWQARVRAVNAVGNGTWSDPATFTKAAASTGPDPANYSTLTDLDTPMTVDASNNVTSIASEGTLAAVFGVTGNSATPLPTKAADGVAYNAGRYHSAAGLTIDGADGVILIAEVTLDVTTGTQQLVTLYNGTTQIGSIRVSGTTAQPYISSAINGTAKNYSAGAVTAGTKIVMAMELDRVAGTIRYLDLATGQIVSEALAFTNGNLAFTRVDRGQGLDGTLHRTATLFRATGQPWRRSFAQVLSDFQQGV